MEGGAKSGKKKVVMAADVNLSFSASPKVPTREGTSSRQSGKRPVNTGGATSGARRVGGAGDRPQRPTGSSKSAGHRVASRAVDLPVRGKTGGRRLPTSTSGARRMTVEADIAREHWSIAKNVLQAIHFEKSFATLHTSGGGEISLSQVRLLH